jgi:hypothetical protein
MPKECSFFLYRLKFETRALQSYQSFGSKKAGWYDPASPNGNASALPLVFLLREKSRPRRLSLQIRRMNRLI